MTDIDYSQILKWILIVLTAGFIGQFGKSLATYLIKRARRTKASESPDRSTEFVRESKQETPSPSAALERDGVQSKVQKKALKALTKMRKKEAK